MKKYVLFCAVIFALCRTFAQSNAPVKLALVSETDEAMPAADLLTAKLSGDDKIQLLERDQIEKVYQEQSLSVANQDYLKLGRILGADGVLLLNINRTPQGTNLTTRLIAVKPGVILADGNFEWPLKDTDQWTEAAATYLDSFLPKLAVLPKDAIPISVVNLRSALSSADAAETERQLKLLIIQRLSQEPQLFVLERQKMQLLGEEKDLKTDDSAFWDGCYLLDGVVDQNGYLPDKVTINAQLTPPKGGAPIVMEASGSRTNLTEVINQLAAKINETLKINSTVPAWTATDEAARYFEEAKWALHWGATAEAQAAADSAWALGKQDLDCALVRVKAYISTVLAHTENFEVGTFFIDENVPASIWDEDIHNISATHLAVYFDRKPDQINYATVSTPPDPENIDRAIHALELYYEFSCNSPDGQSKTLSAGTDWYHLGIEDLVAASKVLQHFNLVPHSQAPVKDHLEELRALTRSVAGLIANSPSVHDSYFVGDRIATYDELADTIGGENYNHDSSIYGCEVTWGCFWQETPEDCVALYRGLMGSPVFCYIHDKFWHRRASFPRVVGWNDEDRKHAPEVWNNLIRELNGSTNVFLRMEGQAIAMADAPNDAKLETAFTTLMDNISSNREELVANNVDLFYLDWRIGDLLFPPGESYTQTPTMDRLEHEWRTNYSPELDGMENEYRDKTIPARETTAEFEQQKQYLADLTPYNFQNFLKTFSSCNYTKTQAAELRPLLAPYESNLVARATSQREKFKARSNAEWIGLYLGRKVESVLNPPAPQPSSPSQNQAPKPAVGATTSLSVPAMTNAPEIITNVIAVDKFLSIPLDSLVQSYGLQTVNSSNVTIIDHCWLEGKLLLNFDYYLADYQYGSRDGSAIALFDPAKEHWDVIDCPKAANIESKNRFPHWSTFLHGELFNCDDGKIEKYDFANQSWQILNISDGNNYELFAINGRLYAANANIIFEIVDGGKGTLIMASSRRQPPVTALDTQMAGIPTLFEGTNHSLRVSTHNGIFSWAGSDWHQDGPAPSTESLQQTLPDGIHMATGPEIFPDGIIFRHSGFVNGSYQNGVMVPQADHTYGSLRSQDEFSCLTSNDNVTRLYLRGGQDRWWQHSFTPGKPGDGDPKPLWKMPANLLPGLPATLRRADLYLLADAFALHTVINARHDILQENVSAGDEYNAALICFTRDFPLPQKIYLKFQPAVEKSPTWMLPAVNWLLCGNSKGIWVMSLSQLDSAITAQKQIQRAEQAKSVAAAKQGQKDLLAKYDLNHNGVIDPDEREAALDDPAFIESELDMIDTNHNGRLDLAELAYFDANHDKILESKEETGIEITQHLLAKRDLGKFDMDGDGVLSQEEFYAFLQANNIKRFTQPSLFHNADENSDGKIELTELESFLNQSLRRNLLPRGTSGIAFHNQIQAEGDSPATVKRRLFKLEVENYWRDPGSITNGLQLDRAHRGAFLPDEPLSTKP